MLLRHAQSTANLAHTESKIIYNFVDKDSDQDPAIKYESEIIILK